MLKHKHTGKIRPHKHTTYAGLFFALLVTGVLLLGVSMAAQAAPPAVNPQSGSVGLTGTVRGPAPSVAATILAPRNGSHTSSIPVTVSGTCPLGTFLNIEKNGVFAGGAVCQDDGTYSLLVDLFDGANALVAREIDALGQNGPDSVPVSIFYDAPSLDLPSGTIGKQLFLQMTTTVVGGSPGQPIARSVTVVGGVGPYAVSWDWGDGATSLSSQAAEGTVAASHSYDRPGLYRVIVRVSDSLGNNAFLQFVTIVNGSAETLGKSKANGLGLVAGSLIAAWPLYLLALVMVLFFWLGERREVAKLRRRHLLLR